ncbi:methylmalonyl-CoA epimerase [soil metagenome]
MLKKLNHVGHIVEDIDKAIETYRDMLEVEPWELGIVELNSINDGARIVWLPIGANFIELIQPTNPDGFLMQMLKAKGQGLYHIAILADDFDAEIEKRQSKGYVLMESEMEFCGVQQRVAFLLPDQTNGVLIELIDASRLPAGFGV